MHATTMALLEAKGSMLRVAATDLYLSVSSTASAEVGRPGSFAADAKALLDRIKMMPEGPVAVSADDKGLAIKAKGSARRYTLRGMPGDDYPPLPSPDPNAPAFTLPAGLLASLIAHTGYAISTDETRAHLNSALLDLEGGIARMVATDGHRLAKVERAIEGAAAAEMLIPLKAITELRRLDDELFSSGGEKPTLTLTRSGASLFVTAGETTFGVKLTDAQFPPWRQVIPDGTATTVRLSRAAMADAIKAVALADSAKGAVRLTLGNGVMRITSESPDGGDGVDELPFEVVDGPGKALIGVNAKYILDVLGALSSEEVLLGVSGQLDPLTLAPVGSEGFVAVVMPMRI